MSSNHISSSEYIKSLSSDGSADIAARLHLKKKYNNKYKKDWNSDDDIFSEEHLERELKESLEWQENEQLQFEKTLNSSHEINNMLEETNYMDSLLELIKSNETSYCNYYIQATTIYQNQHVFDMWRYGDIIQKIILEIELPEYFDDMTMQDKFDIFNSSFQWISGGTTIIGNSLLVCLFNLICCGEKINKNDNKIQIPLLNFMTFVNSDNKTGFPLISMQYTSTQIVITGNLHNFKLQLLVIYGMCTCDFRRELAQQPHNYFILQAEKQDYPNLNGEINIVNLYFGRPSKFLLIYFKPKDDADYYQTHLDYPEINSIKIAIHSCEPIEYDRDEILSSEIFGINMFIVPFSEDVSTWENIYEVFKDPLNNMSPPEINFSRLDTVTLCIDTSRPIDNYIMYITNIHTNDFRCVGGMGGLGFAN